MSRFGGVDCGSWFTKAAVIDASGNLLGRAAVRTGADIRSAARRALDEALAASGLSDGDLSSVWATGFGRDNVDFADGRRTELDCHARGVAHYVQGPLTIVDIGGQDTKVIRLDEKGRRVSHKMNRKCAAGTGSFLDEIALRLEVDVGELDGIAREYREDLELGSFCTVFAATELLAAIRRGTPPADLVRAAYRSLVKRVLAMDVFRGEVVATGGVVAHHPMVVELMEESLGVRVTVPPHPQEMGAFGAALAARAAAQAGAPARAGREDEE
ncbi:MAG: ATPase [Acidobacteria bacterium]|nr:MAG: ATPase [Acidobacteriota bacterium]